MLILFLFPFGGIIWIDLVAIFLLMIGAPSTRKCPVAPESDMAYCTALVTRLVSKTIFACGDSRRLWLWIIAFHASCRVCMENVVSAIFHLYLLLGKDILFVREFGSSMWDRE